MKKTYYLFMILLLLFSISSIAQTANFGGKKFYINPGHGGYDANDRQVVMPLGVPDFWESEGNLTVGLYMRDLLLASNAQVKMSRTTNTSADDKPLSTIAAESNSYGGYFISLHSNAHNSSSNYLLTLIKGKNGVDLNPPSYTIAQQSGMKLFENHLSDKTSTFNYTVAYDYDFYGTYHLGVFNTNTRPGYLVEAWFHDYRPEALRKKSLNYLKWNGWQLVKGLLVSPGGTGTLKGNIVGDIRDLTKSCGYTNYTTRNRDSKLAINGASVSLKNSSNQVVKAFTTDSYHNGVYTLMDIDPGTYTLTVSKSGYVTQSVSVSVTANTTTKKLFDLVEGSNGPTNLSVTQAACPSGDVSFNWTNSGTGWQIHVSTSSTFSSYYLKWVSGLTSYTGPLGFVHNSTGADLGSFLEGTTYYWRIYYDGNYTATQSFKKSTCTLPVANYTASATSICSGGSVTFTNTSTNATSYSWSFTGGTPSTSTAANPVVTYHTAGTYTVSLTATNSAGSNTKTSTGYITVTQTPVAAFTASPVSCYPTQNITFANSSTGATSYTWAFTGGTPSTSTLANPVVSYSNPGTYSVQLTAINGSCQNVHTKSNYITINNPITGLDDFEAGVGHFDRAPTYSGTTVGIATTSTLERVTTSPYVGTGCLRAVLNDNTSVTTNWTIRLLSGTGTPANNVSVPGSGTITFWMKTSTAMSGATVQIWVDDSDGTEVSQAIAVNNTGVWKQYTFDLSYFNGTTINTGNGQIDGATVTLDAIILKQPNTANAWTVYFDNVEHNAIGVGTQVKLALANLENAMADMQDFDFVLFPNPNDGNFKIDFKNLELENPEVEVYTLTGQKVYSSRFIESNLDITAGDLPSGLYFVKLKAVGFSKTVKMMVRK